MHSAMYSPYPIHAADGYYTRDSSCTFVKCIQIFW